MSAEQQNLWMATLYNGKLADQSQKTNEVQFNCKSEVWGRTEPPHT